MYAVIETGGKQYRVEKGMLIDVERLTGKKGDKLNFDKVLLVGGTKTPTVGRPLVKGASVSAEIFSQIRAKKIEIVKKNRRKGYKRRTGHRQYLTKLKITAIKAS